jgi:fatty acid synthase subunit alpha, fungi type
VLNRSRGLQSYKAMSEMMITNSLVKIKEAPPYSKELEGPVLLNPLARATLDHKTGSYAFPTKLNKVPEVDTSNVKAVSEMLSSHGSVAGVGVDQGT